MTHIILFFSWMFSWPFLNKKVPFFIFTFFILLLFSALRFNFGNDYISYYYIYNGINEGRYVWGSSDFLFKQLALLMPNYYFLIGVTSVFFISTIYFLIKNTLRVKQHWLAVMLLLINPYVFLVNLSSLRQSIALCFFIYAVHFATQKKFIKYTFLIIIAAGFHQSAIVLLPVYFFISGMKINVKRMIVIFSVLGLLLFTPVWDRLLIFLLQYFPQYAHYVQTGGQNSLRATIISSFFFFLIIFNLTRQKSPILHRWVMNAVRYEGYRG